MPRPKMVEVVAKRVLSYECVRYEVGQALFMAEEHVQNHLELELILVPDKSGVKEASEAPSREDEEVIDGELDQLLALWKMESIGPEEYMKKFPDGPEAQLAARIVKALEGQK